MATAPSHTQAEIPCRLELVELRVLVGEIVQEDLGVERLARDLDQQIVHRGVQPTDLGSRAIWGSRVILLIIIEMT